MPHVIPIQFMHKVLQIFENFEMWESSNMGYKGSSLDQVLFEKVLQIFENFEMWEFSNMGYKGSSLDQVLFETAREICVQEVS